MTTLQISGSTLHAIHGSCGQTVNEVIEVEKGEHIQIRILLQEHVDSCRNYCVEMTSFIWQKDRETISNCLHEQPGKRSVQTRECQSEKIWKYVMTVYMTYCSLCVELNITEAEHSDSGIYTLGCDASILNHNRRPNERSESLRMAIANVTIMVRESQPICTTVLDSEGAGLTFKCEWIKRESHKVSFMIGNKTLYEYSYYQVGNGNGNSVKNTVSAVIGVDDIFSGNNVPDTCVIFTPAVQKFCKYPQFVQADDKKGKESDTKMFPFICCLADDEADVPILWSFDSNTGLRQLQLDDGAIIMQRGKETNGVGVFFFLCGELKEAGLIVYGMSRFISSSKGFAVSLVTFEEPDESRAENEAHCTYRYNVTVSLNVSHAVDEENFTVPEISTCLVQNKTQSPREFSSSTYTSWTIKYDDESKTYNQTSNPSTMQHLHRDSQFLSISVLVIAAITLLIIIVALLTKCFVLILKSRRQTNGGHGRGRRSIVDPNASYRDDVVVMGMTNLLAQSSTPVRNSDNVSNQRRFRGPGKDDGDDFNLVLDAGTRPETSVWQLGSNHQDRHYPRIYNGKQNFVYGSDVSIQDAGNGLGQWQKQNYTEKNLSADSDIFRVDAGGAAGVSERIYCSLDDEEEGDNYRASNTFPCNLSNFLEPSYPTPYPSRSVHPKEHQNRLEYTEGMNFHSQE